MSYFSGGFAVEVYSELPRSKGSVFYRVLVVYSVF